MTFVSRTIVEQEINRLQEDQAFQAVVDNIKVGKFVRDSESKDYNDRLVYTRELRNFIYNPAVLNVVFSDQGLKEKFFRAFGYKGEVSFTIYPKCWLRDLPLLDIGKNVYLGDNILLGTNQVSPDQKTLRVGKITIGDNTIFNQGCTVGGNTTIGKDCIIGFEAAMGFGNRVGEGTKMGERSTMGYFNKVGKNVTIGYKATIAHFCIIDDGVEIPEGAIIPAHSHVTKGGIYNRRERKTNVKSINYTKKEVA